MIKSLITLKSLSLETFIVKSVSYTLITKKEPHGDNGLISFINALIRNFILITKEKWLKKQKYLKLLKKSWLLEMQTEIYLFLIMIWLFWLDK
jgi:hypothetical protein